MGSKKEPLIYIDGKFYPKTKAKISVYDHGLLYGDGVFEGIRAYKGRVFQLDAHMDRLFMSAKSIDLKIPLSRDALKKAIIDALWKQNLRDSYIRVVITRGRGDLLLDPRRCPKPSVIIIAEPMKPIYGEKPASAIIAATRRNNPTALNPAIKSLNYLNNILAKMEANRAGVTEALMLDQHGFVSEGTGDNIFIVKDGKLITPPLTASILVGVTRNVVIQLAKEARIPVEERNITVHELYNADEAFLTGTAAEVAPLVEVDGRKIGDGKAGPITMRLKKEFKKLTETSGTPIYA